MHLEECGHAGRQISDCEESVPVRHQFAELLPEVHLQPHQKRGHPLQIRIDESYELVQPVVAVDLMPEFVTYHEFQLVFGHHLYQCRVQVNDERPALGRAEICAGIDLGRVGYVEFHLPLKSEILPHFLEY